MTQAGVESYPTTDPVVPTLRTEAATRPSLVFVGLRDLTNTRQTARLNLFSVSSGEAWFSA